VRELLLVRVQEDRNVALIGFPAEFLVERGDQVVGIQSADATVAIASIVLRPWLLNRDMVKRAAPSPCCNDI
jgi:hypothetical protein